MKHKKKILAAALVAVFVSAGALFAVNVAVEAAPQTGAPAAMPVQIQVISPEAVQIWKSFSGHVIAVDQADIRPQVSGRIAEIHFTAGQHVAKDDLLLVIDPRPYEAALAQAKAALEAAKAKGALAEKEYQRAKDLIKTQAVSQKLMDERINDRQLAAAAVQGAEALVESAEVNLDYAYVKAPISGKVSRAEITEGNLVQSGPNAPLLTSIVSDDKLYVDFEIDDQTYIHTVRSADDPGPVNVPVRVSVSADSREYKGTIQSFDNRINPATGTIRARALFNNEDKALLPGMSVSVMMGVNGDEKKILVSERAIGTDQDRKFVYVVDDSNMTAYREVRIGDSIDGRRVILSGLEPGDKVITAGIVRIRPGMPVSPQIEQPQVSEMPEAGVAPAAQPGAGEDAAVEAGAPENNREE